MLDTVSCISSENQHLFVLLGKEQNFMSRISEKAADGYTKALNMMLARESSSKTNIGDFLALLVLKIMIV